MTELAAFRRIRRVSEEDIAHLEEQRMSLMKLYTHGTRTESDQEHIDEPASGRPVLMYSFPELHSAEDRLKPTDMEEVNLCKDEFTSKGHFPGDETVFELCCVLTEENGWDLPRDLFALVLQYFFL